MSHTDRRPFLVRVNDGGTDLSAIVPSPPEHGDAPVGGGVGSADTESADTESTNAESTN